ncbi:MAG TPA: NAD(P)/FAD-dependent oxidoreductase [Thermoleophilaceae bacterium]|nr:NAD(P)/FAD-dependent oxidoreductase [Thermoleophilaceae bacterium]
MAHGIEYDVVIVGGGIAGCAAATLYGRRGARVALVERNPDPAAYKTVCTTFIQASATPTIERLGLAPRLEAAGAIRNAIDVWTRWGWIRPHLDEGYRGLRYGYNVRRETLDPMLRGLAAATPGVKLIAGASPSALRRDGQRVTGVVVRGRDGGERELRAPLVVGADGRGSRVAELAGVGASTKPHGRVGYFAHYRDVELANATHSQMWLIEPDAAFAFPHDDGVTILGVMVTRDKLPAFRSDPEGSLERVFEDLPEAPSLARGRRVSKVIGKLDMTNTSRPVARRGLAFIGDAAMASDPLWGVGCGFALQSAEWLVDRTADAVVAGSGVDAALAAYRRRHRLALAGHHFLMNDFATGRPLSPIERAMFAAAARDDGMARHLYDFATRQKGPTQFLAPWAVARAAWVNLRHRSDRPIEHEALAPA